MDRSALVAALLFGLVAIASAGAGPVGTAEPTLAPFATPFAAPSATPSAAPSATPSATPSAAPSATPSAAPSATPSAAPTTQPVACTQTGQYRGPTSCSNCVSRSSPFAQTYGGTLCYPPVTLSSASSVCTNAVHPAYILSNLGKKDTIVGCINPFKSKIRIVFPLSNSNFPFVKSSSFVGSSLRLADVITPDGSGNGEVIRVQPGINRLLFTFTQSDTIILRRKAGLTVQLNGVWTRSGDLLDYCFVSYLKVCG